MPERPARAMLSSSDSMRLRLVVVVAGVAGALCTLCGDQDCDIYDQFAPSTARIGPPENDWATQGAGQIPPGSPSTRSKREMLGGNQYGSFQSVHGGRLKTETTVPFAFRDVSWEPGVARFASPGPGATGHYLLLNPELPVASVHAEGVVPQDFGAADGSRLSATGQRMPFAPDDARPDRKVSRLRIPPANLHHTYQLRCRASTSMPPDVAVVSAERQGRAVRRAVRALFGQARIAW